jgi:predicted GIY-YIG superfamily endonuclease
MYDKIYMERGIYKIINPEGKIYIGLSKDIKRRWNDYKCSTSMKGYSLLKESFKTLGFDKHIFEIKELVQYNNLLTEKENNKILREREKYWINFYQSNTIGLNQNRGGCGPGKQSEESKQKISEALKGKPKPSDFGASRKKFQNNEEYKEKLKSSPRCPILMYDLEDNFIQEFGNQQLAADYLGVKKQMVWNVLNGFINKKSGNMITQVRGYKFSYK